MDQTNLKGHGTHPRVPKSLLDVTLMCAGACQTNWTGPVLAKHGQNQIQNTEKISDCIWARAGQAGPVHKSWTCHLYHASTSCRMSSHNVITMSPSMSTVSRTMPLIIFANTTTSTVLQIVSLANPGTSAHFSVGHVSTLFNKT